jgi:hypothetical protein
VGLKLFSRFVDDVMLPIGGGHFHGSSHELSVEGEGSGPGRDGDFGSTA